MEFRPEHYYRSALERIQQARYLYQEGNSYSLAMYVAGVAVESMLRAFRLRRDPSFDERHDLLRLFKASGMLQVDREKLREHGISEKAVEAYLRDLQTALNDVFRLWSNNLRYASEDRLRAHLKKITGYKKIKGDYLKAQALHLLNAAQLFINKGILQWPSSAK